MNPNEITLRSVDVTRYVTPLREGGSLPAIVEGNDDFLYAMKFRGAGQGVKALIAELIGGELARFLGFRMPEIVFINLGEGFGRTEPDEEIQDLLKASVGLNLGLHYLSGSITFDPLVTTLPAELASGIVWLDSFLMNVDRTARNTNMLLWHKELWLIDHGAALYFHHSWDNWQEQAAKPFLQIKYHVLLKNAAALTETDSLFKAKLNGRFFDNLLALIPDEWLVVDSPFASPDEHRAAYRQFFTDRLAHSEIFVNAANDARNALV